MEQQNLIVQSFLTEKEETENKISPERKKIYIIAAASAVIIFLIGGFLYLKTPNIDVALVAYDKVTNDRKDIVLENIQKNHIQRKQKIDNDEAAAQEGVVSQINYARDQRIAQEKTLATMKASADKREANHTIKKNTWHNQTALEYTQFFDKANDENLDQQDYYSDIFETENAKHDKNLKDAKTGLGAIINNLKQHHKQLLDLNNEWDRENGGA